MKSPRCNPKQQATYRQVGEELAWRTDRERLEVADNGENWKLEKARKELLQKLKSYCSCQRRVRRLSENLRPNGLDYNLKTTVTSISGSWPKRWPNVVKFSLSTGTPRSTSKSSARSNGGRNKCRRRKFVRLQREREHEAARLQAEAPRGALVPARQGGKPRVRPRAR